MERRLQIDRKIIDCFTLKEIDLSSNLIMKCNELGFSYTAVSKLFKGQINTISQRFCTKEYSKNIFTLINIDTKQEYNCITNLSLFKQIGVPYTENECKYIYELKAGRQSRVSIGDFVFEIKGGKKRRLANIKNITTEISKIRKEAESKRIIRYRISSRISKAVKNCSSRKNNYCEDLIGCSINELIKHLEERFIPGMSWDNYGMYGWHIDHIVPCKLFDLSKIEEQKKCFHYLNLQPLWGTTEIAKKYGYNNYIGNINKGAMFEKETRNS